MRLRSVEALLASYAWSDRRNEGGGVRLRSAGRSLVTAVNADPYAAMKAEACASARLRLGSLRTWSIGRNEGGGVRLRSAAGVGEAARVLGAMQPQ